MAATVGLWIGIHLCHCDNTERAKRNSGHGKNAFTTVNEGVRFLSGKPGYGNKGCAITQSSCCRLAGRATQVETNSSYFCLSWSFETNLKSIQLKMWAAVNFSFFAFRITNLFTLQAFEVWKKQVFSVRFLVTETFMGTSWSFCFSVLLLGIPASVCRKVAPSDRFYIV